MRHVCQRMITTFMCFRVQVAIQNGYFETHANTVPGWFHIVLNYVGSNNGQEIRMFVDGQEMATTSTKISRSDSNGNGRVVVGKPPHQRKQWKSRKRTGGRTDLLQSSLEP